MIKKKEKKMYCKGETGHKIKICTSSSYTHHNTMKTVYLNKNVLFKCFFKFTNQIKNHELLRARLRDAVSTVSQSTSLKCL